MTLVKPPIVQRVNGGGRTFAGKRPLAGDVVLPALLSTRSAETTEDRGRFDDESR
jgi:hypothetical protein